MQKDIDDALREPDVIERSVARIPLYRALNTVKLDTTHLDTAQAAQKIMEL